MKIMPVRRYTLFGAVSQPFEAKVYWSSIETYLDNLWEFSVIRTWFPVRQTRASIYEYFSLRSQHFEFL